MSARRGTPIRRRPLSHRPPSGRPRVGMTLIEVIVACSLLALTFTSLTALSVKLAARNRSNAHIEQRTATFFEQVNRIESMPYDSLTKYLTSDSTKVNGSYYIWRYTIDPESLSTSKRQRYRKISLTVLPRLAPTATQTQTIRRYKSPFQNPLNK
jgi:Tfp pilus assembly protein PilV